MVSRVVSVVSGQVSSESSSEALRFRGLRGGMRESGWSGESKSSPNDVRVEIEETVEEASSTTGVGSGVVVEGSVLTVAESTTAAFWLPRRVVMWNAAVG